ncbi:MAG: hypothetical protein ACRDH0_02730, partial [Actinomycetota bacterium]
MQRTDQQRRDGDRRRVRPVLGVGLKDRTPRSRPASRPDVVALATLTAGLTAWFLGLFVVRGFDFPVGPDIPVYLWWTRLAAHDGLSAVTRPGVPAAALVLAGTLHLPLTAILAGLECALGVMVGLAAAALVKARKVERADVDVLEDENDRMHRATWVLAGILAGTFAVHLATGYLASLAFAALFVAAAVALALVTRRATA